MIGAIIGAVASVGSAIAGGVTANKKRKEADKQLAESQRKRDEWYKNELSQNYLDRADSKAALSRIRDYNEEAVESLNTNAIKSGATAEAKVASASKLNKGYAQTVSDIAGQGAQYKDSVKRQQMLGEIAHDNAMYQSKLSEADGMGQMISNVGGAAGSLGSLYSGGVKSGRHKPVNSSNYSPVGGEVNLKPLSSLIRLS